MLKYTNDRGTQIVLALLKAHGIRKVVASPGTTNIALIASMQYDPWFEMYSSVDERSAAYIACGLAAESDEPVVISCTGATASRNYFPALTEAYYRKLPILVVTGSHGDERIGHLYAQVIDRSQAPKDTIRMSISVDRICSADDEWAVTVNVNKAILELRHRGGGPVHINLRVGIASGFTTKKLPDVRVIKRYMPMDKLPSIPNGRVAVFVGSHKRFSINETCLIERFCSQHNGVVICDHTSGYIGKYKVLNALCACQHHTDDMFEPDLIIHIGEVSADLYDTNSLRSKQVWRVNEDGEIRDLFGNLTAVFEMTESAFFNAYTTDDVELSTKSEYYKSLTAYYELIHSKIPELPFCNIWIAQQLHHKLPQKSYLQLGIFNTLRSWNFFNIHESIQTGCNVGGFGIDGPISTLLGGALAHPDKIHYAIVGDLAFFYDLNCLGNRHIVPNIRVMVINNGCGAEFKNYDHPASQWGSDADRYMAAGGHFGGKSHHLVKHYAEDLGFEFHSASNKDEFLSVYKRFLVAENQLKPMVFEVFTTAEDESNAIKLIRTINNIDVSSRIKSGMTTLKNIINDFLNS